MSSLHSRSFYKFIIKLVIRRKVNYGLSKEFVIQNQFFSYSLEEFALILDLPCEGACVFTDRWRLDELAYDIHLDGPYQTNLPSTEDIISLIQIDRDGQVRRICHEEEIDVLEYQVLTLDRKLSNHGKPLEELLSGKMSFFWGSESPEGIVARGRGRHSTSSSSAFDQPSLSHLNDDDDNGNDKGTLCASTPSPIRYVNSLTNQVP
ncbi:hypothetical protein Tco_1300814 [Tanacetum coccineum]